MSTNDNEHMARLTWRTRWAQRRNRILGSPSFQRWAARTPGFRAIARRKAAGQFDLIAGFVYTQITHIFVQTSLLGFLGEGPRTTSAIAGFLGFDIDATDRILRAGRALELAESPQRGLWLLGKVGAALSPNEGALAMIRHHALVYQDLADPLAVFSGGRPGNTRLSAFWTYASQQDGQARSAMPYSDLMRATQPMVWEQIIGAYPFAAHRRMLDIGGGSGAFVEAVGQAAPGLELGLFDLPDVVSFAKERLAASEAGNRVHVHGGSFLRDRLPTGYDLMTLVRILHDHDDEDAAFLLRNIRELLPPRGRLLIVEPMAETRGAERMGDAYFGLYLWLMGSGRPRSARTNRQMLEMAGFTSVKEIPTPLPMVAKALVATA